MTPANHPGGSAERPTSDGGRVLLLDDDVELLAALQEILQSQGYEVTARNRVAGGLRAVLSADFDVIVCDLRMPLVPGHFFYRLVCRAKPALCSRFLFLTGHSEEPRLRRFLNDFPGLVLYKPVLVDELLRRIRWLLQRPEPPALSGAALPRRSGPPTKPR